MDGCQIYLHSLVYNLVAQLSIMLHPNTLAVFDDGDGGVDGWWIGMHARLIYAYATYV